MNNVLSLASRRRPDEPWLNKRQAAQHLSVSTRWIEERQRDSGLPFRKVAGVNFYRASELNDWIERTSTC